MTAQKTINAAEAARYLKVGDLVEATRVQVLSVDRHGGGAVTLRLADGNEVYAHADSERLAPLVSARAAAITRSDDEYRNHDYATEAIGDGNPYHRCVHCGRSDPEINGVVRNHSSSCLYRQAKETAEPYRPWEPYVGPPEGEDNA